MKIKINKLTDKFNIFLLRLSVKLQNLTFKKLFIITLFIVSFLVILHTLSSATYAFGVDSGIGKISAFDKLTTSNGKWINSKYRNNYYLDIKSLGITDIFEKGTNGIANIVFSLMCMIAYICISAFYFCFDTNISDLFKNIINNMQVSLRAGIFSNVFLVAFVFISIYLVQQLIKRNTVEIFSQILKLMFIIVLSFMLTTETSAVITNSTEIAKTIGAQAVVAINNSQSTQSYAADVSGNLWYTLVHEPWLMMEADNKLTVQDQQKILSLNPSSSDRQSYIDSLNNKDSSIFGKEAGTSRIAQSFIILLLTILKSGIILLIALVQIAFQVMAILCVLLSMVALLLSMVPQLGGMTIIENLAKRIFETQLGIVVTTFMLALMTKMDSLIMIDFQKLTNCGWLIALIIQTSIYVAMIVFRKKIFKLINLTAKNIKNGHIVPRHFVHDTTKKIVEKTTDAPGASIRAMRHAAGKVGERIGGIRNREASGNNPSSNKSSSSGNNLKNNLKNSGGNSNSSYNSNNTSRNSSKWNSSRGSNSKGTGKNLKNNTNSRSTEKNTNVNQNQNDKTNPDIKINDGNNLRSNSAKNSSKNGTENISNNSKNNVQKQGTRSNEKKPNLGNNIVNKNSSNVTANKQKSANGADNKELLSEGNKLRQKSPDPVNSIYENAPSEKSESENPNIIRDNNASTDHTDNNNLQNGEIEEQRPNLGNNITTNESENNENMENTANNQQAANGKDKSIPYVKADTRNNVGQNPIQNNEQKNNVKDSNNIESSKVTREKSITGAESNKCNVNDNNFEKKRPNLSRNINNTQSQNSEREKVNAYIDNPKTIRGKNVNVSNNGKDGSHESNGNNKKFNLKPDIDKRKAASSNTHENYAVKDSSGNNNFKVTRDKSIITNDVSTDNALHNSNKNENLSLNTVISSIETNNIQGGYDTKDDFNVTSENHSISDDRKDTAYTSGSKNESSRISPIINKVKPSNTNNSSSSFSGNRHNSHKSSYFSDNGINGSIRNNFEAPVKNENRENNTSGGLNLNFTGNGQDNSYPQDNPKNNILEEPSSSIASQSNLSDIGEVKINTSSILNRSENKKENVNNNSNSVKVSVPTPSTNTKSSNKNQSNKNSKRNSRNLEYTLFDRHIEKYV